MTNLPNYKHLALIRLSAMGDVAMIVPVVKEFRKKHPGVHLHMVSRSFFEPFFEGIEKFNFFGVDLKGRHGGLLGIFKLYFDLKKKKIDAVLDLHDVLRSKILRFIFRLNGIKVVSINKEREEKKGVTRRYKKQFQQLKPTTERYADVFRSLGYELTLSHKLTKGPKKIMSAELKELTGRKEGTWIGLAPFTQHEGKMYPLDKMKEVVARLSKEKDVKLFVFGGGERERILGAKLSTDNSQVQLMIGQLSLKDELTLISYLDLMLSMDSSNMHMASLVGTPVVSIWGATHPVAGFLGYGQSETNVIHSGIECSPCSVFGNKPCFRHDYACMNRITPQQVVKQMNAALKS